MARRRGGRRVLSWLASAVVALGVAVPVNLLSSEAPAAALSGAQFDPGFIISDPLFYDPNAMTAAQIQSFLDTNIGACTNGQCLNVYQLDYVGRARDVSVNGNVICEAIPAGHYTVAQLVFTTQQSCGISAKVILVTMQKEQSLVTSRAPTVTALSHAMGFACPDTAPCDASQAGVANQIVGGTRQLKAYNHAQGATAGSLFGKPVGVNYLQYNPNSACGGSNVNIRNAATAALYSYTPYQPNTAALNNLNGVGDSCSAYGNRNFWVYYNNWFGSTTYDIGGDIGAYFNALGTSAFTLVGAPQSNQVCGLANGGCMQQFAFSRIYWSPATGAHRTTAGMQSAWIAAGDVSGPVGYPTTDPFAVDLGANRSGFAQLFEHGMTTLTASGAYLIPEGGLETRFRAEGPGGDIGWPIGAVTALPDGAYGQFEGGWYYAKSGSAAFKVAVTMNQSYLAAGGPGGVLGWPTADQQCDASTCTLTLEHGILVGKADGTPAYAIAGDVLTKWQAAGGTTGALGYPTANSFDVASAGGGSVQFFGGGAIAAPSGGAVAILAGPILDAFRSLGPAKTGWPSADAVCDAAGGCVQDFGAGTLVAPPSASAAFWLDGDMLARWKAAGGAGGDLGYPTSAVFGVSVATGSGYVQFFEHGAITWTAAKGAMVIPDDGILASFRSMGPGRVGWPTAEADCTDAGCVQSFAKGALSAVAGTTTATWMDGDILSRWQSLGGAGGSLGLPTGNAFSVSVATGAGYVQLFQGGAITWTSARGAISIPGGPVLTAFRGTGPAVLGWPTAEAVCAGTGCVQSYTRGAVVLPPGATATVWVDGDILALWQANGGATGSLGYPMGNAVSVGTNTYQQTFEHGVIRWDPVRKARIV